MRLLYITQIEEVYPESGVLQKILSIIKNLNDLGVNTSGVSFSSRIEKELTIEKSYKVIPYASSKLKFFSSTINERKKNLLIKSYLLENAWKYDYIIVRYILGDSGLDQIFNLFGQKIILEHNTKELEQLNSLGSLKLNLFWNNLRPGYLVTYLESYVYKYIKEKIFGIKVLRQARFGIAVTNEIAKYEEKRAKGYKCFVISNSIDTMDVKLNKFRPKELNMVMLLSSEYPWHGVNRIMEGIKNYKGEFEFSLSLIGNLKDSTKNYIKINKLDNLVKLYQPLIGDQLDEIMSDSTIGIGSLSLFKANLIEASPLKTRDYLARGLPAVVGYHDTDLEKHEEFKPYYLKVPADDTPINMEEIISFYNRVYQISDVNLKIRNLAVKCLDTKVKMRELVAILEENF